MQAGKSFLDNSGDYGMRLRERFFLLLFSFLRICVALHRVLHRIRNQLDVTNRFQMDIKLI